MIEVDALDSLALTLHHAPGVSALLLGSGVSRAAGIPTGWELTIDLIRRLGIVRGAEEKTNWAQWYKDTFNVQPNYSDVLDSLATTPAERRSILHGYIDAASGEEKRMPTASHRAIAGLVADGKIRVIVTTNFDRLLENALRDEGIEPTVIASDDALAGATPLVHSPCTILKLHGDYLDARIRNTNDELSSYSAPFDKLLDEIFDRYGLIVVGWSGDWDTALRAALLRAPSRRYPLYWTCRGTPSPFAQEIIDHRGGRIIAVSDADTFFSQVHRKVEALSESGKTHPSSINLAIALAKKYCRDQRYAVEWSEFLAAEVTQMRDFVTGSSYPTDNPNVDTINKLIQEFVARSEILRRTCLIGMRWGTPSAKKAIIKAIQALSFTELETGRYTYWSSLRAVPASLCFQWSIAAGLYAEDFAALYNLMRARIQPRHDLELKAVEFLPLGALDDVEWKLLAGKERNHTPHSDFMWDLFESESRDILMSTSESEELWDHAEAVISVEFAHLRLKRMEASHGWFWAPIGRWAWRRSFGTNILDRLRSPSDSSGLMSAGVFGGTPASADAAVAEIRKLISKSNIGW